MVKFKGAYTVLITPFDASQALDEEGLRQNIHFQLKHGIDGLVALGTTGESPTLSSKEKERVIDIVLKETQGKVPVVIGTGSYSTAQTLEHTLLAEKKGAQAVLVVTPYYNRPTQEGLFHHFSTLAKGVKIPIIIYNVPGRTGQNMHTETLKRLLDLPNIIGVKEATGNISQISEVIEMARRYRPDFCILSGDDALTFGLMALGGHGILSVASNLFPKEVKALVDALEKEDYAAAREYHYTLMPFFRGAFIETNPMPIKAAMNMCGMAAGPCRLPLCDLLPENAQQLKKILQQYKV